MRNSDHFGRRASAKAERITPQILSGVFPSIRGTMVRHQFYLQNGDCGNFAVALGRVLGSIKYWAAWPDRRTHDTAAPYHCALHWKNQMWDGNGVITEEQLRAKGLPRHFSRAELLQQVVVCEATEKDIDGILSDGRIDDIYAILKCLLLNSPPPPPNYQWTTALPFRTKRCSRIPSLPLSPHLKV